MHMAGAAFIIFLVESIAVFNSANKTTKMEFVC